ncbi:glutamine synthetase [Rhodobium orientis]|uniref:Glutamine synthetase n=1 Tax=Rhodobium orientis TaxID=34017 RepID=A0A327JSZ5_9HYPH|nr:glutamine synthetase family protein [Rhodobium orientis]MBB4304979.1 glutamine synthetase [Rhodobium orientis]MBK5948813.1 glutamine synthetase [Rhodobium orientis]RAI26428.1 glutamine synthetase [Rhodobium orientis]
MSASDTPVAAARGVASLEEARDWLKARRIEDIECIVPDQAGVPKGKMMPTEKFFSGTTMTMPGSIFMQTISGDYPDLPESADYDPTDGDLFFKPDYSTLAVVPWESDPTAQLLHDAYDGDGNFFEIAPRQVLRRVVGLFEAKGWTPVVAPEIEFYLVKPNTDADYPLEPPIGRSGRPEIGRQSYSISAINEFDDLFDDIYDFSELQGLEIDTLIHEEGAAQMEINLRHGDPLELADQVFMFKRTIREAALRHDMYATFMAKPIADEPGSAMHIHQSIVDAETGANIFSGEDGDATPQFFSYIAGLQRYLPHVMCMLAPYVNSYRRLTRHSAAPINVQWGYDNRTVGLRVPNSGPVARRIENRVPSSDANPYLAIAASLACGYLGLTHDLRPDKAIEGSARDMPFGLPRDLLGAVALLENSGELIDIFGSRFTSVYGAMKEEEFETFMRVISPWEREYLLLNV